MTTKSEFIDNVKTIICGNREVNYGKPEDNFTRIADLWKVYLDGKLQPDKLDAKDVACLMVLMKVARLMNNPDHLDSWTDITGYGVCGGVLVNG